MLTHEDLRNGGIMPQRTAQMHVPCSLVQRGREDRRGTRYVHHELSPPPSHAHYCLPHPVELLLNGQNFSYPVAQSTLTASLCFVNDYACFMPQVPNEGKWYPRGYKLQFQGCRDLSIGDGNVSAFYILHAKHKNTILQYLSNVHHLKMGQIAQNECTSQTLYFYHFFCFCHTTGITTLSK